MKYKIIIKAALELKNLGLLAMIVGIFALTGSYRFFLLGRQVMYIF